VLSESASLGRLIVVVVEPVHIVTYDPSWPAIFAEERNRILEAVRQWVEKVEHIGSTAIPGLDAKPVIDLMAGLKSMTDASSCVEPLTNLGYSYWAEGAQPHHHLFVRFVDPAMSTRTHNLHLVEAGGQYWEERLLFRNYLRKHPETAKEYAELKYWLASRHRDDREVYTEAKADFVSGVVHRARNAL
jgi:GrpB-like predicted nucleotidyltransferase (UPF0157 family)